MAVLIVTGPPCSGKSKLVETLMAELNSSDLVNKVHKVDDLGSLGKMHTQEEDPRIKIYSTANLEKEMRAQLKSDTHRLLNECLDKDILIVDSCNYIKGYRYELFCLAKSLKKCYAVLYVKTPKDEIIKFNNKIKRYPNDLLDEMVNRYEIPNEKNRWDHPLFTMVNSGENFEDDQDLSLDDIPMEAGDMVDEKKQERVFIGLDSVKELTNDLLKVLSKVAGAIALKSNQSTETSSNNTQFIPMIERICSELNTAISEAIANQKEQEVDFMIPRKFDSSNSNQEATIVLNKSQPLTKFHLSAAKRNFIKFILQQPIASSKEKDIDATVAKMYFCYLKHLKN